MIQATRCAQAPLVLRGHVAPVFNFFHGSPSFPCFQWFPSFPMVLHFCYAGVPVVDFSKYRGTSSECPKSVHPKCQDPTEKKLNIPFNRTLKFRSQICRNCELPTSGLPNSECLYFQFTMLDVPNVVVPGFELSGLRCKECGIPKLEIPKAKIVTLCFLY